MMDLPMDRSPYFEKALTLEQDRGEVGFTEMTTFSVIESLVDSDIPKVLEQGAQVQRIACHMHFASLTLANGVRFSTG